MKTAPLQFLILFGKTGSGKSEILRHLQQMGEQVLDLEKLAAHNGSAFGGLGKITQPSQDDFEKLITEMLNGFDTKFPVWVEHESSYLGKLQIPDYLLHQMKRGKMIVIEIERQARIRRIIEEYSKFPLDELLAAVSKVKKKLSQKKYRIARRSIRQQDFQSVVSILLSYYDKAYENGLNNSSRERIGKFILSGHNTHKQATQLLNFYKTRYQ